MMSANVHGNTPALQANDPRAIGIRQVAYLRNVAGEDVQTLVTRRLHDVAGRAVGQQDPRLPTVNTTSLFTLDGQVVRFASVDAGVNVTLPGLAGETLQSWDANGNHRRMDHDLQLRLLTLEENGVPDVETRLYAASSADPGHNLRGQMIKLTDPSGSVEFHSFALTGPARQETRTFHDGVALTSHRLFSPLGMLVEHTDAAGHRQQSKFDVAGQLVQVLLKVNGQPDWQPVLQGAQFDAAGRVIEHQAGNGVISHSHYRAADGFLLRCYAQKGSGSALQDFEYEYDPMGNIKTIIDNTFTPRFFANQRLDGRRLFAYDSLYRLHSATGYSDRPPADNPGRPQPSDPADRRNYTQTYEYDKGNNLIKTTHARDGAGYTNEVFIDPLTNRGLRWKPGDPPPDFSTRFDSAGNLLALQSGQPMQWNNRNQLASVILIDRNGSGPNDEEHYRYSQGKRVYKRHDSHTAAIDHFHEVRYLPGLEIRTRDNGEELHLISLVSGIENVICLHWVSGKPPNMPADQMRYTLSDHLQSVSMELDQQAQMISHEGYLPFGTTAWMVARSQIEVDYRFIRYSGKEMDIGGLYYYGARYYAPWLGRWIAVDPAGDVDGLNLYAFVGNNPLIHVDVTGHESTWFTVLTGFFSFVNVSKKASGQLRGMAETFRDMVPGPSPQDGDEGSGGGGGEDGGDLPLRPGPGGRVNVDDAPPDRPVSKGLSRYLAFKAQIENLTLGEYLRSSSGRAAMKAGVKIGSTTGSALGTFIGGIAGLIIGGPLGAVLGAVLGGALFAILGGVIGYVAMPVIMLRYMKKNVNEGKAREDILESMNNLAGHIDIVNEISENLPDPQVLPSEPLPDGSRGNTGNSFSNIEMDLLGKVRQLSPERQVALAAVMNHRALVQAISGGGAPRTIEESDTHRAQRPTPKPRNRRTVRVQHQYSETFV
ncbi:RHS repeat domain-containing protein [Pseudomonas fluorescens]|nr:RHS repeat-associated core domain-containing protein [Pseudomonas fluorescens]